MEEIDFEIHCRRWVYWQRCLQRWALCYTAKIRRSFELFSKTPNYTTIFFKFMWPYIL